MLEKLGRRKSGFDESQLRSSNLSHYLGVIHAAENLPDVTQILQAFRCPGRVESLHVDVVAGQGRLWVKVIARKAQALHLIWAGQGQYGERDIMLQAEDYVTCTAVHPVNFMDPAVVFAFYNGVTYPMAEELRNHKVTVLGEVMDVSLDVENKLALLGFDDESNVDTSSDESDNDDDIDDLSMFKEVNMKHIEKEQSSSANDDSSRDASSSIVQSTDEKHLTASISLRTDETNERKETNSSHQEARDKTGISKLSYLADADRDNKVVITNKEQTDAIQLEYDPTSSEHTNKTSSSITQSSRQMVKKHTPYSANIKSQDKSVSTSGSGTKLTAVSDVAYQINDEKSNNQLACPSSDSGVDRLDDSCSGDCVQTNKVQDIECKQTQFRHGIEFINEFPDEAISKSDDNNLQMLSLQEFIASELLTSNSVDYSPLDTILVESRYSIDSIEKVNLDVSSLITLVSAISHGRCNFRFLEPILSEQAAEERVDPVMPELDKFLEGKKLFACETAVKSFYTILDTLGGDNECVRAKQLMDKVTIVADNPSFRTECLPSTGKIKDRAKIIFGTGDSLQAVTMTANSGFVRAAQHQGVLFTVYVHAARALTEQKEKTAEIIHD